jgi:anaerobic ribonucleoside-triphosphate reductase
MEETRDSGMIGDGIHFERIRRVTGYLTGDLSTWNDAKRAEERDRVRHGVEGDGRGSRDR